MTVIITAVGMIVIVAIIVIHRYNTCVYMCIILRTVLDAPVPEYCLDDNMY